MNLTNEFDYVTSEISELQQLLVEIPPEDVIDRMSLEARLAKAQLELETLPLPERSATVCLTFRGKPVVGSHSISADFGSKALDAFSKVFTAVAVGTTTDIQSRGKLPDKDNNLLRIIGTTIGSFGFELELPQGTTDLFTSTSPEDTIRKIETLLSTSATGNDDEVTEIVADVPPRAIKLLNKFLEVLVSNESWCGLSYGNKNFRYDNFEQVRTSVKRLADNNVHFGKETLCGKFKGFFPISRTFEFLPDCAKTEQKDAIHGKIDIAVEEPEVLNREWLDKLVAVELCTMQIGNGKPRYTLQSLADLSLR